MLRVLAGAFMISFSAVFVKMAHVGPTTSAFYRMLFGGVILLALALVRRETLWKGWSSLAPAAASGFFIAADLFIWHRSILYIGPGLATILANLQVFGLAAAGVLFFGEKLNWRLAVAVPLAFGGLLLLVGLEWSSLEPRYKLGLLLGALTALCYTAYLLTLRRSQLGPDPLPPATNMAAVSLMAMLLLGLGAAGGGESFAIPDVRSWEALLGLGLVIQVWGWLLISTGLPRLAASLGGLFLLLQPTMAFIWDVAFFDRPVGLKEALGALLTLGGIYLGSLRPSK